MPIDYNLGIKHCLLLKHSQNNVINKYNNVKWTFIFNVKLINLFCKDDKQFTYYLSDSFDFNIMKRHDTAGSIIHILSEVFSMSIYY